MSITTTSTIANFVKRSTRAGLIAGLLATPLVVVAQPGTIHAYNAGINYLNFGGAADFCAPDAPLPCTAGAGEGEANVIQVTQSEDGAYHHFDGLQTTATDDDNIWVATSIGAKCRLAHHFTTIMIDDQVNVPEFDGAAGGGNAGGNGPDDPFGFPLGLPLPEGRTLYDQVVAVNVPLAAAFGEDLIDGFPTQESIFAAGEAEVQSRIASGMSAVEARGTGFEVQTEIALSARVMCKYNGIIQAEYAKRTHTTVPLTIQFLPTDVAAPGRDAAAGGDQLVLPNVEDVEVTVIPDPTDPCLMHLSASIVTNMAMTVEYRWVGPTGEVTASQFVDVGDTHVALFSQPAAIPTAPELGLVAEGGGDGGEIGDEVADVPDGAYSGTYELEVLSPNHKVGVGGFSVPYCPDGHTSQQLEGEFETTPTVAYRTP
jgi:hypothetical protein